MKKNISINISGIIFHIEEDGYDVLKKYLDSISKYFSSFEDSAEIMADIESRIAEIFLSKLNEGKQVITLDDVNGLIATMGSVRDFKAAEDNGESEESSNQGPEEATDNTSFKEETKYTYQPPKPLVRDQKRKILGGVCAGLGYYLNVDPVWIRLVFALFTATYGIGLVVYVVMWIAMPGSFDLEEPAVAKKMYRDSENKALAGVSGGIAAYFGIEIVVVRILFIVFTFVGGIGLLTYIVLWIILPEARTITDRMQMQGEPVTLSNIESNIKKGLDVKEGENESALTKILLFPFRLIAFVITGLAKILGPLTEILRVLIGVFITLTGLSLVLSAMVLIGIGLGIFTLPWPWLLQEHDIAFPLETIRNLVPGWMVFAGCIAALIPSVLVILLGLSIMSKRPLVSAPVGWSLFVLFFVSVCALAFGIPQIAYSFKEVGEYKTEKVFDIGSKTLVLRINEVGMDDYDAVALTLRGHESKELKLFMGYEAHGPTKQSGIENAQMVEYNVEQQDSVLIFDSNIHFKSDAIFRAQRLKMILYIPYDHPFVMDEAASRFITQYVDWEHTDGYTWKMTTSGLECINCPAKQDQSTSDALINRTDLRDFDEIDLSGVFDVTIRNGNEYAVEFTGPEHEKEKYKVYRSGETLVIDFEGKKKFDFNLKDIDMDEVRINITMPRLERLEAAGYGSIRFDELAHTDEMEIEVRGPVKVRGDLNANNVIVNLNGSSQVELSGKANSLNADVKFASTLKAYNLEVNEAIVEVNGASSAKVNVLNTLEIEEGVASDVDYRGNPKVIKRD